jgi:putative aldouronate transport system permease protein
MRSYMQTIPESVIESARIEGANHGYILIRIMVPLSMPVIATITLFIGVQYWNDYFQALMYITRPGLRPLQLYLREVVLQSSDLLTQGQSVDERMEGVLRTSPESIRAATIFATTLPILLVYPFLQRFFIKGIMIGAVKG